MKSAANICRDPNTRRMPFRLLGTKRLDQIGQAVLRLMWGKKNMTRLKRSVVFSVLCRGNAQLLFE